MRDRNVSIEKAAEMLGVELRALFPKVVGVSLHPGTDRDAELEMYVDVNKDTPEVSKQIPTVYKGYPVHIRRVAKPRFAVEPM